jgi:GNAT superfamily N-acetyltransferase
MRIGVANVAADASDSYSQVAGSAPIERSVTAWISSSDKNSLLLPSNAITGSGPKSSLTKRNQRASELGIVDVIVTLHLCGEVRRRLYARHAMSRQKAMIREMVEGDIGNVLKLAMKAFPGDDNTRDGYYANINIPAEPGDDGAQDAASEKDAERKLKAKFLQQFPVLVAEVDGNFAGFIFGKPLANTRKGVEVVSAATMELHQLAVEPRFRRQSIGTQLVNALIAVATDLGKSHIVLRAPESAARFYRLLGWTLTREGEKWAWIEPGIDLRKQLLGASAEGVVGMTARPEKKYPCVARLTLPANQTVALRIPDGAGMDKLLPAIEHGTRPSWLTQDMVDGIYEEYRATPAQRSA